MRSSFNYAEAYIKWEYRAEERCLVIVYIQECTIEISSRESEITVFVGYGGRLTSSQGKIFVNGVANPKEIAQLLLLLMAAWILIEGLVAVEIASKHEH